MEGWDSYLSSSGFQTCALNFCCVLTSCLERHCWSEEEENPMGKELQAFLILCHSDSKLDSLLSDLQLCHL